MESISKFLIISGVILFSAGLIVYFLPKLGLGNLPFDFKYESKNFSFYFPLATCVIISIVLNVIIWLYNSWKQ